MAGPDLARTTMRMWVLRRRLMSRRQELGLVDADIKRRGLEPSTIWRWLNGETRKPRRATIELLLTIFEYGPNDPQRAELLDLAMHPNGPAWLHHYGDEDVSDHYATYISFETEASAIFEVATGPVPGLLQAHRYTEAILRAIPGATDEYVARQLEVRERRRALLTGDNPPRLHAIIDEGTIRRVVGGPAVMLEQYGVLLDPPAGATIQVLPFAAGEHPAMTGGPFAIMEFRDPRAPRDALFVESIRQIFVDSDEDLHDYRRRWDALSSAALSTADSATLIRGAASKIRRKG